MSKASGAASGAQKGYQVGGGWGALAGAVIGFVAGGKEERAQKRFLEDQKKAIEARNKAVMLETSRNIAEFNRQRTLASLQTTEALAHYKRQAGAQTGSMRAAIATADNIGTASLYMQADVERQRAEAEAMAEFNLETTQENINAQAQTLINQALNAYTGLEGIASMLDQQAASEAMSILGSAGDFMGDYMQKNPDAFKSKSETTQQFNYNTNTGNGKFSTADFTSGKNYSGSFGFSSSTGKSGGWTK